MEAYNGNQQSLWSWSGWRRRRVRSLALRGGRLQVGGRKERDRRVIEPACENQPGGGRHGRRGEYLEESTEAPYQICTAGEAYLRCVPKQGARRGWRVRRLHGG